MTVIERIPTLFSVPRREEANEFARDCEIELTELCCRATGDVGLGCDSVRLVGDAPESSSRRIDAAGEANAIQVAVAWINGA